MTERGAENRGKTSSFKKEGLCWRTNKLRFEKISPTISANYENWFLEDILRKAPRDKGWLQSFKKDRGDRTQIFLPKIRRIETADVCGACICAKFKMQRFRGS